jgi:hypothetical protein
MNESPNDLWFFSREGHQSGPITFAELREKADEGALRPRHDLAWTAGMPDWKPVGEIEGLFERRVPTTTASVVQPLTGDPQAGEPDAWPTHEGAPEGEWPGTRRRGYLIALIALPILWIFVTAWGATLYETQMGKSLPSAVLAAGKYVPSVVLLWASIQRLANLGMSRLWILGNLVPILNLWIGYRSFACPAGYAHHKKMDGVGIFLAIIYWLVVTAIVACVVAIVLTTFGVITDPAMQEKLKILFEQLETKAKAPAK